MLCLSNSPTGSSCLPALCGGTEMTINVCLSNCLLWTQPSWNTCGEKTAVNNVNVFFEVFLFPLLHRFASLPSSSPWLWNGQHMNWLTENRNCRSEMPWRSGLGSRTSWPGTPARWGNVFRRWWHGAAPRTWFVSRTSWPGTSARWGNVSRRSWHMRIRLHDPNPQLNNLSSSNHSLSFTSFTLSQAGVTHMVTVMMNLGWLIVTCTHPYISPDSFLRASIFSFSPHHSQSTQHLLSSICSRTGLQTCYSLHSIY